MTNPRQALEEAFNAIHPEPPKGNPLAPMWYWKVWVDDNARFRRFLDAEAWTDAAMMLVPEGWRIIGLHETGVDNAPAFEAFVGRRNGHGMSVYGNAAHPALAIAQAVLNGTKNGRS